MAMKRDKKISLDLLISIIQPRKGADAFAFLGVISYKKMLQISCKGK